MSNYALDNFVGQELSALTECRAASVLQEFPQWSSWLNNFILNSILRVRLPRETTALVFALLRRAEGLIEDYEEARSRLGSFVDLGQNVSLYFRCLRKFESTVALLYQALDLARRATGIRLFEQGDGSPYERLNRIYNNSRHSDPQTLPAGHIHTVWIRNDGLYTDGASLTFGELHELVCDMGRIADKLSKCEAPGELSTGSGAPATAEPNG
jgi:hypothetical protein